MIKRDDMSVENGETLCALYWDFRAIHQTNWREVPQARNLGIMPRGISTHTTSLSLYYTSIITKYNYMPLLQVFPGL